jgi:hypothetical protein
MLVCDKIKNLLKKKRIRINQTMHSCKSCKYALFYYRLNQTSIKNGYYCQLMYYSHPIYAVSTLSKDTCLTISTSK